MGCRQRWVGKRRERGRANLKYVRMNVNITLHNVTWKLFQTILKPLWTEQTPEDRGGTNALRLYILHEGTLRTVPIEL